MSTALSCAARDRLRATIELRLDGVIDEVRLGTKESGREGSKEVSNCFPLLLSLPRDALKYPIFDPENAAKCRKSEESREMLTKSWI